MFSFIHRFFKSFESRFSSLSPFGFLNLFVLFTLLFSHHIAYCLDRSFAWDANTEPDLAGYRIYYKNGDSDVPYNGTGAIEGNSPIQIPVASLNDHANPAYTLHGLVILEHFTLRPRLTTFTAMKATTQMYYALGAIALPVPKVQVNPVAVGVLSLLRRLVQNSKNRFSSFDASGTFTLYPTASDAFLSESITDIHHSWLTLSPTTVCCG